MQNVIHNQPSAREKRCVIACAALFVIIFLIVSNMDFNDALLEQRLHCEMRETWIQTGGEFGWPDYKNIADGCTDITRSQK